MWREVNISGNYYLMYCHAVLRYWEETEEKSFQIGLNLLLVAVYLAQPMLAYLLKLLTRYPMMDVSNFEQILICNYMFQNKKATGLTAQLLVIFVYPLSA